MINTKTGYCVFPLCDRIVERNDFCVFHARHFAGPKPEKVKKNLPKQSPKRIKEQKEYKKQVAAAIKENPECMIKGPTCTGFAQGFDHKQKRSPANFLNPDNQVPACNACNLFKELNPGWSNVNGHSVSRFKTVLVTSEELNGTSFLIAEGIK
jgi:5-methylcytosine-specific restriction endonuclease McrA